MPWKDEIMAGFTKAKEAWLPVGTAIQQSLGADGSYAVDKQINLMPAATEHMERIHEFHNLLLVIITVITIFVLGCTEVLYIQRCTSAPVLSVFR